MIETKAIITIDTEVRYPRIGDPFNRDILGQFNGFCHGVYEIANDLSAQGLRGVYFLDVHGAACYGEGRYVEMCDRLQSKGHSIQLHTHPDQMYDPRRRHMHEYSIEEQTNIILEGIGLLKKWTGKTPIAHRAGRYGANEDTLKALNINGIHLDSSFFYGRADCKLSFNRSNDPIMSCGVWEIPVTVVPEPVEKLGMRFPRWTRKFWRNFAKLDVNGMSGQQLCQAVMEVWGKTPFVVIFLHSFSFIRRNPTGFVLDREAVDSFRSLLRMLADEQLAVATFEEVATKLDLSE